MASTRRRSYGGRMRPIAGIVGIIGVVLALGAVPAHAGALPAGQIRGRLVQAGGTPAPGACAILDRVVEGNAEFVAEVAADPTTGAYRFTHVAADDYQVLGHQCMSDDNPLDDWAFEKYRNHPGLDTAGADTITLAEGEIAKGKNITLDHGGALQVTMLFDNGNPVNDGVCFLPVNRNLGFQMAFGSCASGSNVVTVNQIPAARVKVFAFGDAVVDEYYRNAADFPSGRLVTITAGQLTPIVMRFAPESLPT